MASRDASEAPRDDDARCPVKSLGDRLGIDLTAVGDAGLRQVLTDAEVAKNAVEALQARVMVEMQRRAHRDDLLDCASDESAVEVPLPTGTREEFVVDEISVHLHCTRVAASHRFAVALAAAQYPALGDAWGRGAIDARKVQVIADGIAGVDAELASELAEAAADQATTRTAPQVRAWLARRVIAADPTAAEQRRERATAGRHVSLQPLPDGVALLSAVMPAIQARQIYDTLTSVAHQTDGDDDVRTLDQRRSDALFDLLTGRAEPPQVHLNVTVPATALILDDPDARPDAGAAELHGIGPVTVESIRQLLGEATSVPSDGSTTQRGPVTWRRLLVAPSTGALLELSEPQYRPSRRLDRSVRARDVTCRFPGCRRPASSTRNGVDLDHTVPWPQGPTTAENLACLCRHHHRVKHSPGWSVRLEADGTMEWTTPGGRRFVTHPWAYDDPSPPPGTADPPLAA
jgi:Domain of unknown function (DUF222)